MAFNVDNFKQKGLTFGGARPSLFRVSIPWTDLNNIISGSVVNLAKDKEELLIESASLPSSTLGSVEVNYFGRAMKYAGDRTYEPWTTTVINDEDFILRRAFEQWVASINSVKENRRSTAGVLDNTGGEGYQTSVFVSQFAKTGGDPFGQVNPEGEPVPIAQYKLVNCWPSDVSSIDLNWSSKDEIERFSVTWQYDYHLPIYGAEANSDGGSATNTGGGEEVTGVAGQ